MLALVRVLRRLGAVGATVIALPLALAAWEYLWTPVYDFPAPKAFAGAQWYNPYAALPGRWDKANFHAHTVAWGGLTNGHQTAAQLDSAFVAMGFGTRGISNYHEIDTTFRADSAYLPSYEYGYSIRKSHRLAIGARSVNWLDFPLGQTRHHKQFIIDRLRPTTALIAVNHPRMRNGHTAEDFRWLGNYDFVEAMNPFGDSLDEWDSALSSGHAAWILGDDDTHDISKRHRLGDRWTMVGTSSTRADSVVVALRAGRHYAVRGHLGVMDNRLRALDVHGDTITVRLERVARSIRFVGDSGRERLAVANADTATYVTTSGESYVRIEVRSDSTEFFLNPVLRWDGRALPQPHPVLNAGATWTVRCAIALAYLLLAGGAVALWRRRGKTSRARPT